MIIREQEDLQTKWAAILDHEDLAPIRDPHRRSVTAQILETTVNELSGDRSQFLFETAPTNSMGTSSSTHGAGNIDTFDPVMISMLRRSMPNLIAYDICGVQPMTGPTGLVFALRSRYASQTGSETFYNEVNTAFSGLAGANVTANSLSGYANNTVPGGALSDVGTIPGVSNNAGNNTYNYGGGLPTAIAEGIGSNTTAIFPEMAFSIEKTQVIAKARQLKAEYSIEIAQDLKRIHGLEAEALLSDILSAELLAEINREVVRTINVTAVPGCQDNTTTAGIFDLDTDSNGRWSVEKFKGLIFQIERECNAIAKQTRRGKGNILICSSDVASALQMAGVLDYTPALAQNNLQIDDTGNTFAGILNGRIKVYIDPYATGGNYMTVGFKGATNMDAGLFYCPYVPMQLLRATDPNTMQPKIGFKTRYGMVANPFAQGLTQGLGALVQDSNVYYRRCVIQNLL